MKVGNAGFGCIGETLTVTVFGLLRNHDAPTAAISMPTAMAAIPFIALLPENLFAELVGKDHAVLMSRRMIGSDQCLRVGCNHDFRQWYRLDSGKATVERTHDRAVDDRNRKEQKHRMDGK